MAANVSKVLMSLKLSLGILRSYHKKSFYHSEIITKATGTWKGAKMHFFMSTVFFYVCLVAKYRLKTPCPISASFWVFELGFFLTLCGSDVHAIKYCAIEA